MISVIHRVPVEVVHVLNGHGLPVQVTNPNSLAEALSLLGVLIAIAAAIFAGQSAKAANRSAMLAEQTLGLMQAEAEATRAERSRRADPLVKIHANYEAIVTPETDGDVILTLGFKNVGNRPAERLLVNFLAPAAISYWTCDQYGVKTKDGKIHFTPETLDEDGRIAEDGPGCDYWSEDVGPIDPVAMNRVQFFRLHKPPKGIHILKAVLVQPDIPGGRRVWVWRLRVPEQGLVVDPDPIGGPQPPMRVFAPDSFE